MPDGTESSAAHKRFIIAAALLCLLLSAFYTDKWITPNATSRAVTVYALYEDASLRIDKYHTLTHDKSLVHGKYYSDKAPMTAFLVFPLYWAWRTLGLDGLFPSVPPIDQVAALGSFICGSIPFTVFVLLTLFAVRRRHEHVPSPPTTVMLSIFGSFLFVFAGTYMGHLTAGLFLLLSYILLKRHSHLIAGLLLGLAFLTEYPLALAGPVWAVLIYLRERSLKNVLLFCVGVLPSVIFFLILNTVLTGNPLAPTYKFPAHQAFQGMSDSLGFGLPSLTALWGLLFSPFRGVFFYAPVLLLMLFFYFRDKDWKPVSETLTSLLFWLIPFFLLFFSAYYMWWGGWSFGPRHLIPLVMLVLYEGVPYLSKIRFPKPVFFFFTGIGLAFAWLGKTTRLYMLPEEYTNPVFSYLLPELGKGNINENNLLTWVFGTSPLTGSLLWLPLFFGSMYYLSRLHARTDMTFVVEGPKPSPHAEPKQSKKRSKKKRK